MEMIFGVFRRSTATGHSPKPESTPAATAPRERERQARPHYPDTQAGRVSPVSAELLQLAELLLELGQGDGARNALAVGKEDGRCAADVETATELLVLGHG